MKLFLNCSVLIRGSLYVCLVATILSGNTIAGDGKGLFLILQYVRPFSLKYGMCIQQC